MGYIGVTLGNSKSLNGLSASTSQTHQKLGTPNPAAQVKAGRVSRTKSQDAEKMGGLRPALFGRPAWTPPRVCRAKLTRDLRKGLRCSEGDNKWSIGAGSGASLLIG